VDNKASPVENRETKLEPEASAKEYDRATTAEKPPTFLDLVEQRIRVISIFLGTVAACLALWQYYEANRNDRLTRSWEVMADWKKSPAREAYSRLGRSIEAFVVKENTRIPGTLNEEEMTLVKNGIGANMIARWQDGSLEYPGNWESDLRQVIDFYNEVEFCAVTRFCDATLLKLYFEADIKSVWDYFEPYVQDQRATVYPEFAVATERLLKSFEE
jgi:hypothetical protein